MNIKKDDIVKIVSGRDKGKKAKVLQVFPKINKIVVEGVNMTAKSVRPKKMGEKGQIVRYNAPISASSAMLFCNKCSKTVRTGYVKISGKAKTRVCRKCGQAL